ncbi:hypothetical protein ACP4OV_015141 [Aristida adscensionis]
MAPEVKMAPEKVEVSATTNPPLLMVAHNSSSNLEATAVVRVVAPPSVKSRAPIDLVTLLDVSRSMSWAAAASTGRQSRLDLLKKTMKFILRQLDDDDRLAVVAFNDQVIKEYSTDILEISGGGRVSIEKKVDGLVAKGDTAFKPCLEHAVKLMDDRADKKRVGFIVLISDGLDNSKIEWSDEGIASTDPVRDLFRKYPVHTFGLCKAHDPKALHFIAKESYGTYSSIADNLDSKIMEAFAVCLAGMKSVVAVDTCLNIKSTGYNVKNIDCGGYVLSGSIKKLGDPVDILIGPLCAGEVKDFVVHLGFDGYRPSGSSGHYDSRIAITASVTYKDVPARQPISSEACSVLLRVFVTYYSPPQNPCPPFPAFLQQMIRFKVLDLLTKVLKEFNVTKEETEEDSVDRERGDDLSTQRIAATLLQRQWKQFKQSDASWKEAPTAFLDVGGFDRDINMMVRSLRHGLGVGCVYSWMSSYQMQRPTVTGLPAAPAFLTPAMEEMLHKAQEQRAKEAQPQGRGAAAATGTNTGSPVAPAKEGDDPAAPAVCKRAVELLGTISRRFELWRELEGQVPAAYQPSSEQDGDESRNLAAVLQGDIHRARQHDIYLAADHAIKEWQSSFTPGEKLHGHGQEKEEQA